VGVGGDVLGAAAGTPGDTHDRIVAGTAIAPVWTVERQDRAEAEGAARERVAESIPDEVRSSSFRTWFGRIATKVSNATGSVWAFTVAIALIAMWAVTGPLFGFSDTWQLIANTFTTLVTFLMVFLIQNTQNRDAKATQLKLDELIRAIGDARNEFIDAEDEPEEQIEREKRAIAALKHTTPLPSGDGEPAQHR
jgi:low affinity Fe/Cu permease